jgi:hypothetical protein
MVLVDQWRQEWVDHALKKADLKLNKNLDTALNAQICDLAHTVKRILEIASVG